MSQHAREVAEKNRFEFGNNWSKFISTLRSEQILEAERSLKQMLGIEDLKGKSFLDIGSGSGLFSLAARRLGARVHSFDYDPSSVACALELKERYFKDDPEWIIEEASVLDTGYIKSLGKFDIVYSWGVLHHTGEMWKALANAALPVINGGRLFIAIYNDQGGKSTRWRKVKKFYCSGTLQKWLTVSVLFSHAFLELFVKDILRGMDPMKRYRDYQKERGMSVVRDWFDWLGGYPFEVASPEAIFNFYKGLGFKLERLKTCGGSSGNNEFILLKEQPVYNLWKRKERSVFPFIQRDNRLLRIKNRSLIRIKGPLLQNIKPLNDQGTKKITE